MSDSVKEIKTKINIADFIRSYVTLAGAGKHFKGLCPFHAEKTPSFIVSPERQSWHCFGCDIGGDVFSFLMKYENIEFYEALKILAERAGIELRHTNPENYRQFGVLYDIIRDAVIYYKSELERNTSAINYLHSRGLKDETIEGFDLGVSGSGYDNLLRHLVALRYDINDAVRAGLIYRNERGLFQDRFRNRLMFSICNGFGKPVAFTARILPAFDNGEVGKYINSPETPLFIKSKFFYGLNKSKKIIRDAGKMFIVEGPMDMIMSWKDGVRNGVESMGTALTSDHMKIIERHADTCIMSFDNDPAGSAAGEKALDLAAAHDINAEVCTIRDYKDPADLVANKPGALHEFVAHTKPAIEFYFEKYLGKGHEKKNIRSVLAKIALMKSPLDRSRAMKELSRLTNIEEQVLIEEMGMLNIETSEQKPMEQKPHEHSPLTRKDSIAERIISLAYARRDPVVCEDIKSFLSSSSQELINIVFSGLMGDSPPPSPSSLEFHGILVKNEAVMDRIAHRAGLEASRESEEIDEEIQELKKQLRGEYYKEKRAALTEAIRSAEKRGDETALEEALRELIKIPLDTPRT